MKSLRIAFSWTLNSILPKRERRKKKKPRSEREDKSENHKKSLEWDFLHLRISIHQTINKATKLGTKEESNEVKNVLKLRWFSHLRLFSFGLGWFWDWRIIKVPIAQEDRDRQEIGWCCEWGVGPQAAVLRPVRCESLTGREYKSFPSSTLVFVLFSWFFHPAFARSQLTQKTCRHSSDFFLAVVFHFRAMEVKGPWHSSLEHTKASRQRHPSVESNLRASRNSFSCKHREMKLICAVRLLAPSFEARKNKFPLTSQAEPKTIKGKPEDVTVKF